jgi:hypothetical protein
MLRNFLIFFLYGCSDCGYISFNKEKARGTCVFSSKISHTVLNLPQVQTLLHFSGSVKGQSEDSAAIESVGLLYEQESSSFIDPETVNYNLDLPATSKEIIEEAQISSKSTEYESSQFDLDEDIELEEVKGLCLNLYIHLEH